MIVAYTRTETVFVNPRILEEYFDLTTEEIEKFSPEEMAEYFSEIPMSDLVDLCEMYDNSHTVTKA